MKRKDLLILAAILAACGSTATVHAQPPPSPLQRGDAAAFIGWLNAQKPGAQTDLQSDWYHRGVYAGGAAGWYWTDHLRTEIEIGASNSARLWTYRTVVVDNLPTFSGARLTVGTRRVAIGQQYQFFRNVWFQPHVGAGVDLSWETVTGQAEPIIAYPEQGPPRQITPAKEIGPETRRRIRPFGEIGFKAYMTRRGFCRGDMKIAGRGGVQDVQLRFGFGVDF
jgi:hypothetical protein